MTKLQCGMKTASITLPAQKTRASLRDRWMYGTYYAERAMANVMNTKGRNL